MIQVTVKSASTDTTIVLSVEPTQTVAQIKDLVKQHNINVHNLVYTDKPLDDTKTLEDYSITSDAVLHLESAPSSTVVTSHPPKKRKRCSFKNCISAPLRGVGDCGFCQGHFCSKHRLLEQHDCIGLHNCKQQLHERNAVKLQEQQTVANKV
uniref:ARAD1B14718p n=1 Tax=Blastobotrys adeninivorans TaxID=409370 RepID=A0A060T5V4_BLAAD